ncbi:MAG: Bax inhibitor-1/YccA family membrane protein, partial [Terracidiphilus sp.]
MPQLMRTSNPALNEQVFRGERAAFGETMTVQGTVNKTGILLLCAVATAAWTWNIFLHSHSPQAVAPLALIGVIGGLIFAFATIFK